MGIKKLFKKEIISDDNISTCSTLVNKKKNKNTDGFNWKQRIVYNYKLCNELQCASYSLDLGYNIDMEKIKEDVLKNKYLK